MQLDFDGIGFKLRVPIYNIDGDDLKLRTAVIPLIENGLTQSIEITEMQLSDEEHDVFTSFQDDIEPSKIEVNDSRKTVNAVFHSVTDKGDSSYSLCINITNISLNQKIVVHYSFNAGSTIATFKGVDVFSIDEDCGDEAEVISSDVLQEENETDNQQMLCLPSDNGEVSIERATELLWIANKQIEEASIKLLDQETRIAFLEGELSKSGNTRILQNRVDELEEENKKLSVENSQIQEKIQGKERELQNAYLKIHSLENMLAKAKSNPVLPPASDLEKHLNNILEYMESTAKSAGIMLENIYVRTSMKDGKRYVNIYGEIRFAKGKSSLNSGCSIKASLYDASGKIEIEGSHYVSSSFKGYDTFNIGWNGGTDSSWLSETKIRIFVV